MTDDMIYVTQPFMPPLEEFLPYLERIWESKRLTNNGPLHEELECSLRDYLGVPHIVLFNNGTVALLAALRALRLNGEVITTPFSFIATSHALRWTGLRPVFVDVEENGFNIDVNAVEDAITEETSAILPVHCYGYPCDTGALSSISERYEVKVLYDAAHSFSVEDAGGSILRHGDLSVLSFHATKVFTTFEGGAVVCHDEATRDALKNIRNFGIAGETRVVDTGINGKLSEVAAAFGLLQMRYFEKLQRRRGEIDGLYRQALREVPGIALPPRQNLDRCNFAYFPILVTEGFALTRDDLYEFMKANGVHPRRYFYPLITDQPMYIDERGASAANLPNATRLARQILCLPIFPDLQDEVVLRIVALIVEAGMGGRAESGSRYAS
jgi:dTDP-4-amino-4,6-dideoxygalactose transaminase